MSGEKALSKDVIEECNLVEKTYKENLNRINDMYNQRLEYIARSIAKHSGNTKLINSNPFFTEFFQFVKPDGLIYYKWSDSAEERTISFRVNLGREFNLVCMFPTSWVFNDSFEEELIEGRKRYLELNESKIIKSIKDKLTSEELALLHRVTQGIESCQ